MEKKVVLITGASNGMGAQMAKNFANDGYYVAINYNASKEKALDLVKEISDKGQNAIAVKGDVKSYNECERMINEVLKTFGHVDVLINNAGVCSNKILIDETCESISNVVETNLIGTINCSKAIANHFIARNQGKIINMSSIWGLVGGCGETVYSATKGGIIAFTKALAKELSGNNITVNCIAPGVVDTRMLNGFSEDELTLLRSDIPLGRFAKPEEIAHVALFIADDKASYITGETISINGGFGL